MPAESLQDRAAGGVLLHAGQLDALVATCLQDAVGQLQALSADVLACTAGLQRLAAAPDAPPGMAQALQQQVSSLLRIGQFHDMFGQAVARCLAIQGRRADLVATLVAALQEEEGGIQAVLQGSRHTFEACRDDQARHASAPAGGAGSVELF